MKKKNDNICKKIIILIISITENMQTAIKEFRLHEEPLRYFLIPLEAL